MVCVKVREIVLLIYAHRPTLGRPHFRSYCVPSSPSVSIPAICHDASSCLYLAITITGVTIGSHLLASYHPLTVSEPQRTALTPRLAAIDSNQQYSPTIVDLSVAAHSDRHVSI
jgi:hypothetical protein